MTTMLYIFVFMYIYLYVHLRAKYIHYHLIYTVPFIYGWKLYILAVKIYFFDWKRKLIIPSFSFFTPNKRTQNSFTTISHILDVLFILIFISIVTVYISLFTLTCLYLFTLTLYTCVLFIILYELDEIDKIWEI